MRGMTETVPIQDTFASGLGAIERLEGNCFRFVFYVSKQIEGEGCRQVVADIIVPASAIPDAILQMIEAIQGKAEGLLPLVQNLVH